MNETLMSFIEGANVIVLIFNIIHLIKIHFKMTDTDELIKVLTDATKILSKVAHEDTK